MLINRHGYAKALSQDELNLLIRIGFTCARDRTLFAVCLLTACRISEARQMHFCDAFDGIEVRKSILIRQENSKGKQRNRVIPTHPDLAYFLQEYYQDALHLLEIKRIFGNWTHLNLNDEGKIISDISMQCPKCNSHRIFRSGAENGCQRYSCRNCNRRSNEKTIKRSLNGGDAIKTYDPRGVISSCNYGFLFEKPKNPFLFPGLRGEGCLHLDSAFERFEFAFKKTGILGAATHSCRRTALTIMHREGILLRVIQEISGHKKLENLQLYLEVTEEEVKSAVNALD